MQYHVKN